MTPADIVVAGIAPAAALLPPHFDTASARVLLLAICGQEAGFQHRAQILSDGGRGPARGLLQFERGGGVRGVMRHPESAILADQLCARLGVTFEAAEIWRAIEFSDALAFGFGRLLLWTDPRPLPARGEVQAAWEYYLRNWRPGKPHRNTWNKNYLIALNFVNGETL